VLADEQGVALRVGEALWGAPLQCSSPTCVIHTPDVELFLHDVVTEVQLRCGVHTPVLPLRFDHFGGDDSWPATLVWRRRLAI